MGWLRRLWTSLRGARLDRELDEELDLHVAMRTEANRAAGLSDEEATHDAARQFGNRTILKERTREMDILPWLETLGQDVRYALRQLRRAPGFAAFGVVTLALAMCANTAVFSVVDAIVIQSLPYREPDRLVRLFEQHPERGARFAVSPGNFLSWRERSTSLQSMVAMRNASFDLLGRDGPTRLGGAMVSAGFLSLLGVDPVIGRDFDADESLPEGPEAA